MAHDDFPPRPDAAFLTYHDRIASLRATEQRLDHAQRRLSYVRLAFGIAVVILLFPPIPPLLLPVLGFALAAHRHELVLRHLAETRRALSFYDYNLLRLEDRWAGVRPRTTPIDPVASLYAADLDIFGTASLFELLCEARTSLGATALASWLLLPASMEEVLQRQTSVRDLRERTPLREAFAAAPGPVEIAIDSPALKAWLSQATVAVPGFFRWLAPVLALTTLAATWRYAATGRPMLLILVVLVEAVITFQYRQAFKVLLLQSDVTNRTLIGTATLLHALESQEFSAPKLKQHHCTLLAREKTASAAIAQLATRVTWAEARANYFVRLLDVPLLYSVQCALALQDWRKRFGPDLLAWLHALGECEALMSLGAYSFEHPEDSFPTLQGGSTHFEARGLGHVLLPQSQCVRNDVLLTGYKQLLLISGSNMSGKSTLLRSVGVNAVLALAGAPVRAYTLTLSPLTVVASIQVNDSLQQGRSRFYAEILRLHAIVSAAKEHGPILFLIDELLSGTNSSDRAAGAQGLITALLQLKALGLLSTHDLALTELAAEKGTAIHNMHFQDEFVDGQLRFSYKLQEGVVERSNGVALMRMIGLDV